jgi:predicted O-methyltransferase YrrM
MTLTSKIKRFGLKPMLETSYFSEIFETHISKFKGWLERDEALFLHELAKFVDPECVIVEIGSYEGKSTVALSSGSKPSVITIAVDPHTGDISEVASGEIVDTYSQYVSNIANAGFSNKIITKRMHSVTAAKEHEGKSIGLLFVDGWHSTEAVIADIDSWIPFLSSNAIIVFDDWNDAAVKAGIKARRTKLPQVLGSVGKDLAFTNSNQIRSSTIGQFAKKMHRRLLILNSLRRLKITIKTFLSTPNKS